VPGHRESGSAPDACCSAPFPGHLPSVHESVLEAVHRDPKTLRTTPGAQGLAETLFERLQALHGGAASEMLTVQYRMHADVMDWASAELYGGRLTAAATVGGHTLADLPARAPARSHLALDN